MAADYTAYNAVLKEVWTSQNLEKQFYNENPFLDKVEKGQPSYTIGDYAIVPVHTGRSGGYSVVPRTGSGALNPADEQKVNQAQYTWTHHWFQIKIEESTARETSGKDNAVANVVDTEVNGALSDVRKQITRQFLGGNADSLIAQCGVTSSSTTVVLGSVGAQAITRGWLYVGQTVDIGTTANEVAIADAVTITAVNASTPSITISGSTVSTTSSHYVSIANARSGATAYEANGLQNLIGTATLAGINPASEPTWQATVNSTTQDLSLSLLYAAQRSVAQVTGKVPNWVLTSLKQRENLYKLLQVQARFDGDSGLTAGNVGGVKFAGMEIDAEPDVLDGDWYSLTKEDLFLLRDDGPKWATDMFGGKGPLEWAQGTTAAVGGLAWHIQLAVKRRNSHHRFSAFN